MLLRAASAQKYDIGRVAIWGIPGGWDTTQPFFTEPVDPDDLTEYGIRHYGNTEGPVDPAGNPEYSNLTIESSGPGILKRYFSGAAPTVDIGVFPDVNKLKLFSPTGTGSIGRSRRSLAYYHTLWLVAEELFIKYTAGQPEEVAVTFNGATNTFLKDGQALSADDQHRLDTSIIIWKADFTPLLPVWRHEDGGKSLKTTTLNVQQDFTKPEGCQLYMMMSELADFAAIDLDPSS